jgi:hypothetical protein
MAANPGKNMTSTEPLLSFLLTDDHRGKYPHRLVARFPHVAMRLEALWNDAEAVASYFTELMVSSRPNRQGFPPDIAAEIMSLSMAYDRIGPIKPVSEETGKAAPIVPDPWERERAIAELERLGIRMSAANFARAAEAGDHALCMLFILAGFDIDARDARHWTPLMIAAFNGNETLALELIRYGADIHARDMAGYTPLHWAACNGYPSVVKLLLGKGAPADAVSNAGITPMLQAAARGHADTVALLLKARADPNITASDGSSPLLKAVANGHLQVIAMLLKAGASTNVKMKNGKTLIDIAHSAKDPRVAELIARPPTWGGAHGGFMP